ncbi:MAG: DUF5009 domain-containing protein [Bryobacteraceae bacterium]
MTSQSLSGPNFPQPSIGITGQRVSTRVVSVDIFRGLTMIVMIFVNDLASVKGLPWWTYHMPGHINAMTYVDMVFPAFLFIVGMAIPLAINARLTKHPSIWRLWVHVILRAASLLVIGLILANAEKGNRALMGIQPNWWAFIAIVGCVLFWNVYPKSARFRTLFAALKNIGLLTILVMFAIFRRITPDGHFAWIDTSYWEILGIIGWAYLSVCILYIPTRRWRWAPSIWLVLLLLLNIASTAKWLHWPGHVPPYLWPFGAGSSSLIVMAGVVTSHLFLGPWRDEPFSKKELWASSFACLSLIAGWLLTPLGISKIRATPTWCLYCIAANVLIFAALYWICDIKGRSGWAWFAKPAGANTLTTYLVPDLYYFATATCFLASFLNQGWTGVVRSIVFTALMLAIAALLTKWKVRMQL